MGVLMALVIALHKLREEFAMSALTVRLKSRKFLLYREPK
jgi:zinc transporter ZupT